MPPIEQVLEENCLLKGELAAVKAENAWLKHQMFGAGKTEKLDRLQATLALAEVPAAAPEQRTEKISYERASGAKDQRVLPAEAFKDLPIAETIEVVPEEVKKDPSLFEQIGEERTFEVDIVPPRLVKREIVRLKYRHVFDRSRAPLIAPAPMRPVQGGYASAGLLAWIALSKYVDHLPLYRLERMSQRWGATISRQTMNDWIRLTAQWFEPIYRQMLKRLLSGNYLQADETPVRCNDPDEKRGGTTEGWLWVISRPGEDVVFDWRLSRRHNELTSLLNGYKGILQADAYGAYPSFAKEHPEVSWVGCWAHARRKFFEAQAESPKAVAVILRIIGRLYQRERQWDQAKVSADQRKVLRFEYHTRSLYWLRKIVFKLRERVLPKSLFGKACDYLLRYWDALSAHLRYGQTRLDNNLIENVMPSSA